MDQRENNRRMQFLAGFIKYGHIKRSNNHHLYYIDTKSFFENDNANKDIRIWLRNSKKLIRREGLIFNILVTVVHHSNMEFVHLVNEILFEGVSTIIRLNLNEEFRDNIRNKYSYLRNFEGKIKFHFIDDAAHSGRTILKAKSYVCSIFDEISQNIEVFSTIIVLINRLPKFIKEDLFRWDILENQNSYDSNLKDHIYLSYIDLFVPTIKDPHNFCYLCNSFERCEDIIDKTVFDAAKFHLKSKLSKLVLTDDKVKSSSSYRFFNKLQISHNIYSEISSTLKKSGEVEKAIDLIYEQISDIKDKIDFFKVLSRPILSFYLNVKRYIFFKVLIEIEELISKECGEIKFYDYNLLLVLMKRSSELNSNFILRKKIIYKIWDFFSKFCEKYKPFLDLENTFDAIILLKKIIDLQDELKIYTAFDEVLADKRDKIKQLNDEYSIKFSTVDYSTIYNIVKESVYQDGSIDVNLIVKTKYNIANFDIIYLCLVKNLVFEDEAKTLWLEGLLRSGHEIDEINNKIGSKYITYNKLYRFNESLPEKFRSSYKNFLIMLLIENNYILLRTLKKLKKEKPHYRFTKLIKDDPTTLFNPPKEINELKDLFQITKDPYYYNYFREFITKKTSEKFAYIYMLSSYLDSLEESIEEYKPDINKEIKIILFLISKVMDADISFFAIRKYLSEENTLYTIGRYNCNESIIPFKLSDEYFTQYEIQKKEVIYHNFLTPKSFHGIERRHAQEICVLRLIQERLNHDSNNNPTLCTITFLYKAALDDEQRGSNKENLRLVMLLKSKLQTFVEKNFSNANFNSWIEKETRNKLFEGYYRKFKHNAGKYSDRLLATTSRYFTAHSFANIVTADLFLGEQFAKFLAEERLTDTNRRIIKVKDIFNDKFIHFLSKLPEILDKSGEITISSDFDLSKKTNSYYKAIRYIIIELVINSFLYKIKGRNIRIQITSDGENIIIENNNYDLKFKLSELNKLIKSNSLELPGITLFTVHKYILHNYRKHISLYEDEDKLNIRLPIIRKTQ